MATLILLNKPFGVVSQFTTSDDTPTLKRWIENPAVKVAGRLDKDSEGLLLLTDDGRLQAQICEPKHKMWKTYWVQLEGIPSAAAITQLCQGLVLKDGPTLPARMQALPTEQVEAQLWPRTPPVRQRQHIPTSWWAISIREGRNRQIRRMTAAIGHPTLRLVRQCIGHWQLQNLQPGQFSSHQILLPADERNKRTKKPNRNPGKYLQKPASKRRRK